MSFDLTFYSLFIQFLKLINIYYISIDNYIESYTTKSQKINFRQEWILI